MAHRHPCDHSDVRREYATGDGMEQQTGERGKLVLKTTRGLNRDNTLFVVLSFEGPDRYSLAGGLGVRVSHLSQTLAQQGYPTHLLFVGDPYKEGREETLGGRLTLHRWCQWISRYHPDGVYQAENEKLWDFDRSAPYFITDEIIKPAVEEGKAVVVMGEEWQTAKSMCTVDDLLKRNGIRDNVLSLWNANNTFSFDRIDWSRLSNAATITTVSRYMKHIMWKMGLNPLVIPNGIPKHLLNKVNQREASSLRKALGECLVLTKVARWDPDKRWNMAVEAVARMKSCGHRVALMARGGVEPHGTEVLDNARQAGLRVKDVLCSEDRPEARLRAIEDAGPADVLNIKFYMPEEMTRVAYNAADGVLANSGHEPFGLVGLETMAAGGVAFTGCTGEDYAVPLENAIVLETDDPGEIVEYVTYLEEHKDEKDRIRKAGKRTAQQYAWEAIISNLVSKLEYLARHNGVQFATAAMAS
ncbi:MAG: glycosyltransferase [Chloroflexi bacterium]|nr:glycosyltransferase [Chloroflexota bacterium]